jgi:hypothetical protein
VASHTRTGKWRVGRVGLEVDQRAMDFLGRAIDPNDVGENTIAIEPPAFILLRGDWKETLLHAAIEYPPRIRITVVMSVINNCGQVVGARVQYIARADARNPRG